ncbi:MAG: ATP12 family protein, partial [Pseudomonadota bacterium]
MSLTPKTPLGSEIIVPNKLLEAAILQEWQGQGDAKSLKRENMPLSQIASIKIDLVQNKRTELIEDIISYSDTDSVCYRAGDIEELFIRQELILEPIIAWANRFFAISLIIT